jgi:hypothetical protein
MPAAGDFILAVDFPDAAHAEQNADETGFSNTTYGGGSNACGVAFVAPTSGRVRVDWYAYFESNGAQQVYVSAAVRQGGVIGSGTVVEAATDTRCLTSQTAADDRAGGMYRYISGLTAGQTYNARVEHRVDSGGGTGDMFNRTILVTPLT